MSNVEYKPAEKVFIRLVRPDSSASWGFRLQGGIDFSTPLSIQSINPGSVSERCGLKPGDAILSINNATSDAMTHDEAKAEIMRSGNEIVMLVERGAVTIWKPKVTPLNDLRPQELNTITSATGEDFQPVQKTSLAINKPPDEPCRIGSTHNRAAQPFGQPKVAVPNVVHAQYNSPMGLYSANNIADSYSQQTAGIQSQMQSLDISDRPVGARMTGTYQSIDPSQMGQSPFGSTYGSPDQAPGFHSVAAPIARPPSDKPQQPSMRCGGCDMLATGVIVKANGVPYHVACFKCTSCSMNLKQKGFFVVEGNLYCETHAKRQAKPPGPDMVAVPMYR
ncbi:hypothetical protein BsWGS_05986 [Bradybaena similaris]